eukprot:TRINITY_DN4242_c0_g1_i1.p2 TRINITY_DN4242_c0_g1~~TRINITY_DN4242_c0_g1_i1.p2  ORF type:complete len:76 (+),score=9.61 TRINITY_DN4242_c0_g1_i1:400-627(+)
MKSVPTINVIVYRISGFFGNFAIIETPVAEFCLHSRLSVQLLSDSTTMLQVAVCLLDLPDSFETREQFRHGSLSA